MIARLIGIIGSTHGVRFSARPPRNTISRIASGPRPSNMPRFLDAVLGVVDELQEVGAAQIAAGRAANGRTDPAAPRSADCAAAVARRQTPGRLTTPDAPGRRWRLAAAERDRRKRRVRLTRRSRRRCRHDVQRPLDARRSPARSRDSRRTPDSGGAPERRGRPAARLPRSTNWTPIAKSCSKTASG